MALLTTLGVNTVNALDGHVSLLAAQAPAGATSSLNIGNLNVSPDATVTFTGGNGGFFAVTPGLNNSEIFINSINGVAIPAVLPNKILGGWAIANDGEFASYVSAATPGSNNINWGVTTMNGNNSVLGTLTQDTYDGVLVPNSFSPTQNIRISGTGVQTIGTGGSTINVLAVRAALTNLNFTNPTDVLNLASGGLAFTNGGTTIGAVGSGIITAGGTASSGTSPLYVYSNGAANTINSVIADNGLGSSTRLIVVPIANASISRAHNTNTGGTVINAAGGIVALTGAAGTVVIPAGGVTINNTTLSLTTNQGEINPANDVTLNGTTLLTWSAPTLNSVSSTTTAAPPIRPSPSPAASVELPPRRPPSMTTSRHSGHQRTSLSLASATPTINVSGQGARCPLHHFADHQHRRNPHQGGRRSPRVAPSNALAAEVTTLGNNTVSMTSTASAFVGQSITGVGIPAGTSIASIVNGTTLTISNPATATGGPLSVTTNATTTVTTASTTGLAVGQAITGTGIPAGATISSITNATTFVISTAATASGTVTATINTSGVAQGSLFTGGVNLSTGTLVLGVS